MADKSAFDIVISELMVIKASKTVSPWPCHGATAALSSRVCAVARAVTGQTTGGGRPFGQLACPFAGSVGSQAGRLY